MEPKACLSMIRVCVRDSCMRILSHVYTQLSSINIRGVNNCPFTPFERRSKNSDILSTMVVYEKTFI